MMKNKIFIEDFEEKFPRYGSHYWKHEDIRELALLLQKLLEEKTPDAVDSYYWQTMEELGYFSSEELAIARGNEYHRTWVTKEDCRDYLRLLVALFEKFQEKDGVFIHTNHCNGTTEFRVKQYGENDYGIEDENGRRIFVEYRGKMICLLPDHERNDELWR